MSIFTVLLKNRSFISKIRRSKVTDYAALNEGIFPDIWKLANVIAIFEKGSKLRPVALFSCIVKLQKEDCF